MHYILPDFRLTQLTASVEKNASGMNGGEKAESDRSYTGEIGNVQILFLQMGFRRGLS